MEILIVCFGWGADLHNLSHKRSNETVNTEIIKKKLNHYGFSALQLYTAKN